MTIEQKINNYIEKQNDKIENRRYKRFKDMGSWIPHKDYKYIPLLKYWNVSFDLWKISSELNDKYVQQINKIIDETDETECLTSSIRHIRETKKKLMENK